LHFIYSYSCNYYGITTNTNAKIYFMPSQKVAGAPYKINKTYAQV